MADRGEDLIHLTREHPLDAPYHIPDPDPIIKFTDIRSKKSDDEPDAVMPTIEASIIPTSEDNNSQTSKIPLSPPSDITETSPMSDAPETQTSPIPGVSRSSEIFAILDIANTLPKRLRRTRKRKHAYATEIKDIAQMQFNVLQTAFTALVNETSRQKHKWKTKVDSSLLNRFRSISFATDFKRDLDNTVGILLVSINLLMAEVRG